jgi:hypothetical protein
MNTTALPATTEVTLSELEFDKKYQVRLIGVAEETLEQYQQAWEDGAVFPPITVFRVEGNRLILTDGWHRTTVAKRLGLKTLPAVVQDGTEKEAWNYARFTANRTNGLRLTRSDLQALCESVVTDPEFRDRTDLELARLIGCNDKTVAAARKRVGVYPTVKVSSDGRVWVQKGEEDPGTVLNRELPAEGPEAPEDGGKSTLASKVLERLQEHLADLHLSLEKLESVRAHANPEELAAASAFATDLAKYARALAGGAQ